MRFFRLVACSLGLIALAFLGANVGCEPPEGEGGGKDRVHLDIFAASSLQDAFRALEASFEREHPEVDVRMTFAGSQVLRMQIEQGANADVYASANRAHVAALAEKQFIVRPRAFASNEVVLVIPRPSGPPRPNDARIRSFTDLRPPVRLVVGNDSVPIGIYTDQLFQAAATLFGGRAVSLARDAVVSRESNVRLVRAKVAMGEADAAFIYRSDALSQNLVQVVPLPDELRIPTEYFIAATERGAERVVVHDFLRHLQSASGRDALDAAGLRGHAP